MVDLERESRDDGLQSAGMLKSLYCAAANAGVPTPGAATTAFMMGVAFA
jgi:hypothetical protein